MFVAEHFRLLCIFIILLYTFWLFGYGVSPLYLLNLALHTRDTFLGRNQRIFGPTLDGGAIIIIPRILNSSHGWQSGGN